MASGETKRQEMTSGDILVCRIPLLIFFESTGCEKRGGITVRSTTSAGKVASLAVVNHWDISSSRTLPTNNTKAALEQAAESSASWAHSCRATI